MSDDFDSFDTERWREELEAKRAEKDDFFAEHPQSPIPPDEREEFDGLSYFDPAPAYRVAATLELEDDPGADPVTMETTSGGEMRYLHTTTLSFELTPEDEDLQAGEFELAGYEQEGAAEQVLFVPFRDKTTGQQTYPGGRYMELALEAGDFESGSEVVLDFNLAYTPFCAYSDVFECPLPPAQNWLEVVIPAGEQWE